MAEPLVVGVARGSSTDPPQHLIDASHRGGPPRGVLLGIRGADLYADYIDRADMAMTRAAWIAAVMAWADEAGLSFPEALGAIRSAWAARS